jgi:hypothetical protein
LYKQSKSEDKNMTLVEYLFRHKGVTENGVTRAYNIYDLKDDLSKVVFKRVQDTVNDSNDDLT